MADDKIYIGIDDEIVEAKGEVLESLLEYRAKVRERVEAQQAEAEQKALARLQILERLGLTEDEAKILLG